MDYSKPYVTCTEKGTQRVYYMQGGKKFTPQDLAKAQKKFKPKAKEGVNLEAPPAQQGLPKAEVTITPKVSLETVEASETPQETPAEEPLAETPAEEPPTTKAQVTTEPIKKYKTEAAAKGAMTREGLDITEHRVIPYEGEFVIEEI